MSTWGKKTIYHSELVQASDPGGLLVRFKSAPHESKFQGQPPFMPFEVHGDEGSEYLYNIENGDIHSYLGHAPIGQWVLLFAGGSRDAATIRLEDKDGNPVLGEIEPEAQLLDPEGTDGGPPPNIWPADTKPAGRMDMLARFGEVYAALCEHVGPAIGDATRASIVEAAQKIVVTEAIQK